MQEGRVSRLIDQAEARRLDALGDNMDLVDDESGRLLGLAFSDLMMLREEPIDLEWLLKHDMPGGDCRTFGCCQPIIRAKALQDAELLYDEDVRISEDYLLYGRMIISGLRFGVTAESGYRYYLRSSSLVHAAGHSDGHVAVNSALRSAWSQGEVERRDRKLEALFHRREAAFRYADFVYAAKSRKPGPLLRATLRLKFGFALGKLIRSAGRRIRRAVQGSAGSSRHRTTPFAPAVDDERISQVTVGSSQPAATTPHTAL